VKLDHINNNNLLQSNATVKYGTIRDQSTASLDVGLKRQSRRPLNVIADGKLTYAGREWSLSQQLTERAPRDYSSMLTVRLPSGTQAAVASTYKMSPRHEFTNDITVTNMQPIRFNGHFNPALNNMQARVDISYEGQSYLVDANWMHRGTASAFNTRASAEVNIAGRTAGLSAELGRRNDQLSVNVELKYDHDKRIAITSRITASMLTPRYEVRVEWPRNFLAVTGSGRYDRRGRQATNMDLEGSMKVTSSLAGYEELSASWSYSVNGATRRTTVNYSWAQGKQVS